ncbi:Ribose-5-phosphate isomerase A [Polystyrenella longa]|uniref:Ribose-5-phosphate isomerase A n=1 Tax=Polystyrenella longa TaxID=2528007 RepID=A0A518CIH7_9PLAN|nr:ribose-5-phosphate isomerase RpiA [Polystyrenella longa]QDU79029.1 Ribose-5-phosphate isomerase A [Polystyrenella longa]
MFDVKNEKQLAAEAAVGLVKEGMIIGLGSGSTAAFAIEAIGKLVAGGMQLSGIPTSVASEVLAKEAGIPLTTLEENPVVDLTIDGADRFDDRLNLIKGGGGAMLREKIVASCSKRLVIITDAGKYANPLSGFPVPVEVVPFSHHPIALQFEEQGLRPVIRQREGAPFVTDEGNYILDLQIDQIDNPQELERKLDLPGVVGHGLFTGMADELFMGDGNSVQHFTRDPSST